MSEPKKPVEKEDARVGGGTPFLESLKGRQRGLVMVARAVACSSTNSEPQAGERLCLPALSHNNSYGGGFARRHNGAFADIRSGTRHRTSWDETEML